MSYNGLEGDKILFARGRQDGRKDRYGLGLGLVPTLLGWWSLLFSQEWWGHIQYEVLGSPVICR
jgi:hypothetical protein